MQLLWLKSDYIVPPDTGGKIRTYNLLRELRKLCDVTYVSLKSSDTPNTEPLMQDCADEIVTVHRTDEIKQGIGFYSRVVRRIPSTLPYIVQKYRCPAIRRFQKSWPPASKSTEPAVIVCDFLEMTQNIDWSTPYPKVLFQHNVESLIWKRYVEHESNQMKRAYFSFEANRMRRYESKVCNRFDLVLTVSQEDRALLQSEFGVNRPMEVIETGVDINFFFPRPETTPVPGKLVFLGSLDWMPNIDGTRWFIHEVYPHVKSQFPGVTLDLVGRRPTAEIRRFAALDNSIGLIPDVPDVRPYIAQADLFIVPLRIGGGSRIKIYEAMAMARPVVSTRIGAEGLDLVPGHHIAITDEDPVAYANELVRLLTNPSARNAIAQQGFHFVVENFPWSRIAQKFHQLCLNLAQQPHKEKCHKPF
ncbi:MAG: glycosyltransferase [Planctomycetota bacterium]|nr:glycosyltransferase [Planctomycetota bacterium]MDA1177240.1 glycosyltransferase [Planctomycetota bacterium]